MNPNHRKMFERVSAMAKIGVWECDLASQELTWTDAVYDLFDLPRGSEVSRAASLSCYEPASRREMESLRAAAIKNGTGFKIDVRIRTASGNHRWIRITADVEQERGVSVRIFGTKQDISEEKFAQLELHELHSELIHLGRLKAMNAMASTLAHELNQPLTAMAAYMSGASRLLVKDGGPPELSECIDGALEATMRAADIIRRVRAMTRKGSVTTKSIDLTKIVEEAATLTTAGHANIKVTYELPGNIRVRGDHVQIQQVLINLFQNSWDAAEGKPCQIHIRAAQKDKYLEVCVVDDGPGVPAEILPQVFEFRVTTKPQGMGIGLPISRTIIESHGGHITARNLSHGGASFCFTLPMSDVLSA